MKRKITAAPAAEKHPTEDEIRDYTYHLYVQNGHRHGQDVDNWHEAEACLRAHIPKEHSHIRLHRHLRRKPLLSFTVPFPEAKNLAS